MSGQPIIPPSCVSLMNLACTPARTDADNARPHARALRAAVHAGSSELSASMKARRERSEGGKQRSCLSASEGKEWRAHSLARSFPLMPKQGNSPLVAAFPVTANDTLSE